MENGYEIKEGYLIDLTSSTPDGTKYKGIEIKTETIDEQENTEGIEYYKEAYKFTKWFKDNVSNIPDYLNINSDNDPEDETSRFVQHKRKIIKNKIEGVLNSSITAYSKRTFGHVYKMPKLSEEDWQKIYGNISMITFFQGKNIGLTKYNGYCVLNSTNHNEYVNPNLMYFIDNSNEYHDIRCSKISSRTQLTGYKIGDFQKIKLSKALDDNGNPLKDENEKQLYDNDDGTRTTNAYKYNHTELACYECINGPLDTYTPIYNYIKPDEKTTVDNIKTAYWTSLARERYNTTKLLKVIDSKPNYVPEDAIYNSNNGHYYKVYYGRKTWEEAKNYCEGINGHLVTITSAKEQKFIQEKIMGNSNITRFWMGAYAEATNDGSDGKKWYWTEKESNILFDITNQSNVDQNAENSNNKSDRGYYINWAIGQPDTRYGEQNYAIIENRDVGAYSIKRYQWDNVNNDVNVPAFICEWD